MWAKLILLPELHTGVYFCQTEDTHRFDQAESIPGPTTEALGALGDVGPRVRVRHRDIGLS